MFLLKVYKRKHILWVSQTRRMSLLQETLFFQIDISMLACKALFLQASYFYCLGEAFNPTIGYIRDNKLFIRTRLSGLIYL